MTEKSWKHLSVQQYWIGYINYGIVWKENFIVSLKMISKEKNDVEIYLLTWNSYQAKNTL